MSQQGKRKSKICWTSIHDKKLKVFLRTYAHSQFLCSLARLDLENWVVHQTVQPHTFYGRLLVLDKTLVQPHFAVVNGSDAVMSVFHSIVLTRNVIFLQL